MTAELIRKAREARGLTLRQAGEVIGVQANTVGEAELRGERISVATLRRYAAGYGYRLEMRLVGEAGEVIEEDEPSGGREQEAGRMARGQAGGD